MAGAALADRGEALLLSRRSEAVLDVDRFLAGKRGARRLSGPELKGIRNGQFQDGWQVDESFSDGRRRTLRVLTDREFPYSPARIALSDPPGVLEWPHVERDGLLCLLPRDSSVDADDPAAVVDHLLESAWRLVEDNVEGVNTKDFQSEFLDYWRIALEPDSVAVTSILEPLSEGRQISVWHGASGLVVGENASALET